MAAHGRFSSNMTLMVHSPASSESPCVIVLAVCPLFLWSSILLVFSGQLFNSFLVYKKKKKNSDSGTLEKPKGKIADFLLPLFGHVFLCTLKLFKFWFCSNLGKILLWFAALVCAMVGLPKIGNFNHWRFKLASFLGLFGDGFAWFCLIVGCRCCGILVFGDLKDTWWWFMLGKSGLVFYIMLRVSESMFNVF